MNTLTLDHNLAQFQIHSFMPGCIQINHILLTSSCIVTANKLIDDWPVPNGYTLNTAHLACIHSLQVALLLIGTGQVSLFIQPEIYGKLINQGIAVEIMPTRAACHTFNVLTAEKRPVAAALIIR